MGWPFSTAMASDWIKFEITTPDKPEVIRMADIMHLDQDAVVGKLLRLWVWADANSIAAGGMMITEAFIDRLTARKGFAAAMRAVGWLLGDAGSLSFPNFDRHNGVTAKARAESNRRMKKTRETRNESCGNVAEKAQQKPQPEKRREEIEHPSDVNPPLPSAPPAWLPCEKKLKVGSWFKRRASTPWSPKEIKAWCSIPPDSIDDGLAVLHAPYLAEEKFCRKDLLTLLNNWQGEIDRWRSYKPPVQSDVKPAQLDFSDPPFVDDPDAIFHKPKP